MTDETTNKNDLRVRRSEKLVKEAFLTIVPKKPYERITVTDIADAAMVNRKTVYRHFFSVEGVADSICHDLYQGLAAGLRELQPADLSGGYSYFTIY